MHSGVRWPRTLQLDLFRCRRASDEVARQRILKTEPVLERLLINKVGMMSKFVSITTAREVKHHLREGYADSRAARIHERGEVKCSPGVSVLASR